MKTLAITMPKDARKATQEDLETTGIPFEGVTYEVGDTIEFPETVDSVMKPLFGKDVAYFGARLILKDRSRDLYLPFGSILRIPDGKYAKDFLDKYEVNKEVYHLGATETKQASNWTRLPLLAGKKLRVKEIVVDQKAFFVGKVRQRNEDNSPATQPGDFYVWEWVA
jgi:hypothetical protein